MAVLGRRENNNDVSANMQLDEKGLAKLHKVGRRLDDADGLFMEHGIRG